MTTHEIITLASIVEKEAAVADERGLIASVFLTVWPTTICFQSCAVQYILGEVKPVLSTKDTQIESTYNTYLYPGLPPGPISAPGDGSIKAALYPENSEYYYFVTRNDGSKGHYFGRTLQEHNENIARAEQNKK